MDAREIVTRLAERWNAGDLEGMVDLYADDVVVEQAGWEDRSC